MSTAKHPGMLAIEAALVDAGFKRRKAGLLTREFDGSVIGWLGLNTRSTTSSLGIVLVNPVVGVRHQALEQLVAEGDGRRYHPYSPPTFSEPLSVISPSVNANSFILHNNDGDDEVVRGLVDAVLGHGLRFMTALTNPLKLAAVMEPVYLRDQAAGYRYPPLLWLAGDRRGARRAVKAELRDLAHRTDVAADEQRAFLSWFSQKLEYSDPPSR